MRTGCEMAACSHGRSAENDQWKLRSGFRRVRSGMTWSNMDRIWYILSIVATSISLVEKGPSVLVENGLRYRLCNWYYEIETKSLDLRHRVKQPVPKALFSTRWRFHPYQSMLVKKYIKSGKIFHMKYMQLFHAYHPRPALLPFHLQSSCNWKGDIFLLK